MTLRGKIFAALLAIVIAAELGMVGIASAAKVSYAEAWRLCRAELDRERVPGIMVSNDRYLRGGACMRNYGYHF